MKLIDLDLAKMEPEHLKRLWPQILPLLNQMVEATRGKQTLATLSKEIRDGLWQAWVVFDDASEDDTKAIQAFALVGYQTYPAGLKVALIGHLAGRHRHSWFDLFGEFCERLRSGGAERIEVHARRGWVQDLKQLGFKETQSVMEAPVAKAEEQAA